MSKFSCILVSSVLALATGCAVPHASSDADEGPEATTDSAALSVKLAPIKAGERHGLRFDGTTKWFGFAFHGTAKESISIFASSGSYKQHVDTVVYLYKVSKTTGRIFGKAIAYDDDTARTDWTTTSSDSSIDSFVLPEERDYAILVRTYDASERGLADVWFQNDLPKGHGAFFPSAGPGTDIASFSETSAKELPISAGALALQKSASSNGWMLDFARVQLDPDTLAAVVSDDARFRAFGYDMMYYAGTSPFGSPYAGLHGPATLTKIDASVAVATLQNASTSAPLSADSMTMRALEQRMVESILGDGDFATATVDVYQVHWDNSDDTNAEGILAVDRTSGESRAVTFVNPP